MAASKHARTHVNTLLQCSPISVGLAQAHPSNTFEVYRLMQIVAFKAMSFSVAEKCTENLTYV